MSTVRQHLQELHKRHARLHRKLAEHHEEAARHHGEAHDCEDCRSHHEALARLHKSEAEHHEEKAEELASPGVNEHTDRMARAAGVSAINLNPEMGERNMVRRAGQPTRELSDGLEPEFAEMLKVEG